MQDLPEIIKLAVKFDKIETQLLMKIIVTMLESHDSFDLEDSYFLKELSELAKITNKSVDDIIYNIERYNPELASELNIRIEELT